MRYSRGPSQSSEMFLGSVNGHVNIRGCQCDQDRSEEAPTVHFGQTRRLSGEQEAKATAGALTAQLRPHMRTHTAPWQRVATYICVRSQDH